MASLTLPTPPAILVALKPLPPRFASSSLTTPPPTQLSLRRFLSPRYCKPLRFSFKPSAQFSPVVSMASNEKNAEPLWNSLGKAIENIGKKPSVEELLRQQIEKQEYYDDGGGGGNRSGGGGGGGGGGDGLGGSEEEGFSGIVDETIQVVLATLGFIFMYVYIINGAEMTRLAKDFISYLLGGRKSVRLTRALYQWERFCKQLTEKKEVDRYWLEKAIINTPTWYDHPDKYRRILKSFLQPQSRSHADEDMSEEMSDGYY